MERAGRGCRRLRALGSLDAPPRYPSGASGCSKPAENRLGNPFSLALSAGLVVVVNFLRESRMFALATSARCFGSPRRRSSSSPKQSRSPVRRGSWAAASSIRPRRARAPTRPRPGARRGHPPVLFSPGTPGRLYSGTAPSACHRARHQVRLLLPARLRQLEDQRVRWEWEADVFVNLAGSRAGRIDRMP